MAIPATYTRKRDICIPGQIADTSLYNIDGTCAAANDILTGVLVALSGGVVDGHKVVDAAKTANAVLVVDTAKTANAVLVGVTTHSHYQSPEFKYDKFSAVNVMTHGRVWCRAASTVTAADCAFKSLVTFGDDGTVAKGDAGLIKTGYTHTGEWFKNKDGVVLVKIQLTQDATAPAAPATGGA